MNFSVTWKEDSTATVLARITARQGTGAATGIAGEGNWLKQADLTSITCKVFDLDSATPATPVATPSVVISTSVLDTPVTATTIWTVDATGYNFIHDLDSTVFATGGHRYNVEYKFTMINGSVFHCVFRGQAQPIEGS